MSQSIQRRKQLGRKPSDWRKKKRSGHIVLSDKGACSPEADAYLVE